MSYQVLARKWRPRSFAEMVGQAHVVRALSNALDQDRLHHAFLFSGTRGVGKTTLARILAKCLNCEEGVASRPCGECTACREIDEGRFVDLIEIDAASRAKVDETRELMDNVPFLPTRGRYKVYLIDEVHMFSTHSFNALLKTLEEPPPHIKFLLATTDPQKLPVTVLSRCLQFSLKRLPRDQIESHLRFILEREGIGTDDEAPRLLAHGADGSMRDALSLLDQAVAFCGSGISGPEVRSMLGTLDHAYPAALLEAVAGGDGRGIMECVETISGQVTDFGEVLTALISLLHKVAIAQLVPGSLELEGIDSESVQALAEKMTPEDVQLYFQIALAGQRDLPLNPDQRSGLEMTLLRMLAFRPVSEGGGTVQAATPASVTQQPGPESSGQALPERAPEAGKEITEANWSEVVNGLGLTGVVRELALNSVFEDASGDSMRLRISPAHARLLGKNVTQKLQSILAAYCGSPLKLDIAIGPPAAETPAAIQERQAEERRTLALMDVERDPNVRAICETFDARIDGNSIRPADG